MDFADFSNSNYTSKLPFSNKSIETYQNWGHAYFNVAVWNFIITSGMIIPVASFVESFKHEAIYHPNEDNWTWSYNFSVNGTHEAELTGSVESENVIWEMRIDGLLWYSGNSNLDGTGGYWIVNKAQDLSIELLQIDWNIESEDIADIKFTNIEPGGTENGGYIFYGKSADEYDRFYDIYNKGQDKLTEIEWFSSDKHGHVREFRKFGDNEWHCWDSTLVDVKCE